ncbi:uncharacterized protein METZ01_LOCUS395516, partial [marine metagenome]
MRASWILRNDRTELTTPIRTIINIAAIVTR